MFQTLYGNYLNDIFSNETIKQEIIDSFPSMTPELFEKIAQRHQIEEEIMGRRRSESNLINPINLHNFRKLSTIK